MRVKLPIARSGEGFVSTSFEERLTGGFADMAGISVVLFSHQKILR